METTRMILSVGGEPRAVIASLRAHKPAHVCFFASQQSVDLIGEIKRAVRDEGLSFTGYKVICGDESPTSRLAAHSFRG